MAAAARPSSSPDPAPPPASLPEPPPPSGAASANGGGGAAPLPPPAAAFSSTAAQQEEEAHILFLPYPFQGHLSPMINLALTIASSTPFSVTFLTTHFFLFRLLRSAGLTPAHTFAAFLASHSTSRPISVHFLCRHLGLDADSGINFVGISDGWPLDRDRSPRLTLPELRSLEANLEAEVETFLRQNAGESSPVTCIVSDSFMPWTQDVANRLRIPRAFFWSQSMAVASAYSCIPSANYRYDPFTRAVTHRGQLGTDFMVDGLPGLPTMDPYDLPFYMGFRTEQLVSWISGKLHDQFSRINEADWVFVNSFDDLECSVLEALKPTIPKLMLVGPLNVVQQMDGKKSSRTSNCLLRASMIEEDGSYMSWLDTKPEASVLFISFGSVLPLAEKNIAQIAEALLRVCRSTEMMSCLWVCRSWEKEMFPEGFWEEMVEGGRRSVMVVKWVSQVDVLAHRAVGGFLTHAGWNSTLESLSMGVPMICCPLYLDQFTNSWSAVEKWKVGVELKHVRVPVTGNIEEQVKAKDVTETLELEWKDVEEAIRRLMVDGEDLRMAAAKLKFGAEKAWGISGSSRKNLEAFAEHVHRIHQSNSAPQSLQSNH